MRRCWLVALALFSCGGEAPAPRGTPAATPAALAQGERLFARSCAGCHGERAAGTAQGPPLAHRIYQPGHHADAAFVLAVRNGVRAHHWRFGDMPPVPGVSPEDVAAIVGYVRWVQREAGIY